MGSSRLGGRKTPLKPACENRVFFTAGVHAKSATRGSAIKTVHRTRFSTVPVPAFRLFPGSLLCGAMPLCRNRPFCPGLRLPPGAPGGGRALLDPTRRSRSNRKAAFGCRIVALTKRASHGSQDLGRRRRADPRTQGDLRSWVALIRATALGVSRFDMPSRSAMSLWIPCGHGGSGRSPRTLSTSCSGGFPDSLTLTMTSLCVLET